MNDFPGKDPTWNPCPPGLLQEVAIQPSAYRRTLITKAVLTTIALLSAGTVFWFALADNQVDQQPVVKCEKIQMTFVALIKDEIKCCNTLTKITNHLSRCEKCLKKYNEVCCAADHDPDRPERATIKPPCSSRIPCPSPAPCP